MTLIELFNRFDDASKRVNLTSDARSLFLAFMQHWNAQRRPQAVDISLPALRQTAKLDDEQYRCAAICLSNLKFWRMKRKAHDKQGRIIYIGEFFLAENMDRREAVAESAISASPPAPPSEQEEKPPSAGFSSPETKTEQSTAHEPAQEKPPSTGGFSAEQFRGRQYETLTQAELNWINKQPEKVYDQIIGLLAPMI